MEWNEYVLARERVLWDRFVRSAAFEAVRAKMLSAYKAFQSEQDAHARRENAAYQEAQRVMAKIPKPGKAQGMLLQLPPRLRKAKCKSECQRLLAQPKNRIDRFAWYLVDLCEKDERWQMPENPFDSLTQFDQWSDHEAKDRDFERSINLERRITMTAARWFQSRCKARSIPIDIEVTGSTVLWAYNGSDMSDVEVDYLLIDWVAAGQAALGAYVPLEPLNGVQRGIIYPDATPLELERRYLRSVAY